MPEHGVQSTAEPIWKNKCLEKHRPSQGAAKQQTVSVVAGPLKVPYVLS